MQHANWYRGEQVRGRRRRRSEGKRRKNEVEVEDWQSGQGRNERAQVATPDWGGAAGVAPIAAASPLLVARDKGSTRERER